MSRQQRIALRQKLQRPAFTPHTPEQLRKGFAGFMSTMHVPTNVIQTPITLGNRPAVQVEHEQDTAPGSMLYFHGGSYVVGSPATAMSVTASLVSRTGIRALSLDYRLAPEHPFPAAMEDGLAAYRELLDNGTSASSIVLVGDSTGGGLAVAVCMMARDAGLPVPAAVVTFSAGLDKTHTGKSRDSKADVDPIFAQENFDHTDVMFLAGQDPRHEWVSPATYGNLQGFPPLLLQVGTNELLLDDSTMLAERARAADVDVILDITADVPHVFQAFTGQLDEADEALDRAALFIKQRIAKR